MKKPHWLDLSEYALLAGSGIGSVAAVASQQVAFAAAPLSILLLLNLINRRRFEQLTEQNATANIAQVDQQLSDKIAELQQQVKTLPNFLDLDHFKKTVLHANRQAIAQLQQEMIKRLAILDEWNLHSIQQDMDQLQARYTALGESVAGVRSYLPQLATSARVEQLEQRLTEFQVELLRAQEGLQSLVAESKVVAPKVLQDQINQLHRRVNNLPQPFDASSLKQDVESLIHVVADLVPRRELARLSAEIGRVLHHQQTVEQSVASMKISIPIFRKQLDTLATRISIREEVDFEGRQATALVELQEAVLLLQQQLEQLPNLNFMDLQAELQETVLQPLEQMQKQLINVQKSTENLEEKQQQLQDWVRKLPELLDSGALQSQLQYVIARIEWTEGSVSALEAQVEEIAQQQFNKLNELAKSPEHELIFDLKAHQPNNKTEQISGRRAILEEALEKTQERLIVVYPCPSRDTIDPFLIQGFEAFLKRGGQLDIGWGYLEHTYKIRTARCINQRWSGNPEQKGFLQLALHQLTQLKRRYPNQFKFKVLGTEENFLVCDRSFAVLGVHPVTTASTSFPELAIGLRTSKPEVIQGLIDRFNDPALGPEDATAYFSRAATRYDLGDKQGAISDYTQVLRNHPSDDVAYNNRGLARYDLRDKQGAISDYDQAIQINPDNVVAYCNRGFARWDIGDKLGAIADYTYAIQIDPDCAVAYFYRGLARTRLGNKLGAIEDYTEVIRIDSQDGAAYFYRGLASIKLGERERAIADLKQSAQLYKTQGDNEHHQQALETLNKIEKTLAVSIG